MDAENGTADDKDTDNWAVKEIHPENQGDNDTHIENGAVDGTDAENWAVNDK